MPDLRIEDIDSALYARIEKQAQSEGKSVEQFVRDTLSKALREEAWAQAGRIRKRIGPVSGDSTQIIREHRDNDEPYR
jgi:hypothetical protein